AKVKIKYDEGGHIKRKAKIVLNELLYKIGFADAHVSSEDGGDGRIIFNIDTDTPEILIGKSAQTLDAIQYIFDKIINLPEDSDVVLTVDVGYYRKKKVEETVDKALSLAEKVKKTGRSVKMPPMAAIIRKEVHIALRNIPGVNTVSFGDGQLKQLSIVPEKVRGGGKHFSGRHSSNRRG
ncbi:MAG: single-stranded DNA-binding protein, partial [Mucispirillum sp.]|nr:single-stranded DNA-binding protein [Mucispirillum sp.]